MLRGSSITGAVVSRLVHLHLQRLMVTWQR